MVKFKDFSRHLSDVPVLFKADSIFKDFTRQPKIFKYFSSLCEPWVQSSPFITLCLRFIAMNHVIRDLFGWILCSIQQFFSHVGKVFLGWTSTKQRIKQGTKIFQYCSCPAGQVTYNIHSSWKHMHLSFKSTCNKEHKGVICNMTSSSNSSQDECFGKNYSSFLDFTCNYERTSGIFVPCKEIEYPYFVFLSTIKKVVGVWKSEVDGESRGHPISPVKYSLYFHTWNTTFYIFTYEI